MTRLSFIIHGPHERERIAELAWKIADGYRVEFKAAKRSDEQSAKMWAMLGEVSDQVVHHGLKLSAKDWKLVFLDGLKRESRLVPNIEGNGFVSIGRSSSDLTVGEMSDLIELIYAFGARHGVTFREPAELADG